MPDEVVTRAVKLLALREHSGRELAQKLTARGFSAEQVRHAIDVLREKKLLSDARFAAVYARQKRQQFGDTRIRLELRARGVGDDDIDVALRDGEDGRDDAQRAREVLAKKYPGGVATADKAKAVRFLQMRGFSLADSRRAINAVGGSAQE